MAITQQVIPSKLRHLQSFVSSGNFYPPAGTTVVYVAVLGATGGNGSSGRYSGGAGGAAPSGSGYVQVNPGAPHVVSVGAGGSTSAAGGTTSFDGAITVTGGRAGNGSNEGPWGSNGNAGAAGSLSSVTSLPSLNPGNNTIVRVTGTSTGGNITAAGTSGIVHVYGY